MNSSNYRLKINLSEFYKDERKLSYIYIDSEKILKVAELHQKISDVFHIDTDFHLFADKNIFLPLNEDIRVIEKNETITVLPGCLHRSEITDQLVPKEAQKNFVEPQELEDTKFLTSPSSQTKLTTIVDDKHQVIVEEQDRLIRSQQVMEDFLDSKNHSITKRKRSRKRGRKNKNTIIVKHLKFDSNLMEHQQTQVNGDSPKNSHKLMLAVRSVEPTDLSLLLRTNRNHRMIGSDFLTKTSVDPNEESINYAEVNPLDYPTYNSEVQVDDVIAFRTLKMGEDYSPTVSGYIIAKAISKDDDQNNYVFKILEGHDQMKTPNGKFSLPNDEENDNEDANLDKSALVTLNASHLVEPRLICRVEHS